MPRTKKLVDLEIEETSGVDHPAHLYEGWLVRKDSAAVLDEVLTEVRDIEHDTDQGAETVDLTETTIDAPAEEAVAVEPEQVIEPAPVVKSDDSEMVAKELADLRKALDDATAEAASLREEREMEKATERVSAWRILPGVVVDEFAPVLRSLRGAAPESAAVVESILDGCASALSEAGVLKELGTDLDDSSTEAYDQIEALAKSAVEAGRVTTMPEAISLVATENPDLYSRYRSEAGV
jgi:metal-sulfur cluster biosynthetic enzyme